MAARSIARRADAPTVARPRPAIRDLTGRRAYAVEWDVRTAYDFVLSLSDDAGSTDDLPAADREWLTNAKAGLRADVGDAVDLYATEFCIVLAVLAVDHPEVKDAVSFVRMIDATDDETILRTMFLGDRDATQRALVERALAGDEAAIDELVARESEHRYQPDRQALEALYRDPASGVEPARAVLRAWLPRFAEVEARVATMIERDHRDRAADRAALPPVELVEKTTGGIRWLAESGVRRVILAPSYFARPYNFVLSGEGWQMFAYPIADTALDATDPLAPPQSVVRLHRALGDDTRLRILKLLAGRDWYLSEIAQQLELSKPTIKHHLAILRSAGLVTLTEEGALSYYSLRRSRIDDASTDLGRFLST
jgi:DNA-binding transcriptional ArsR family regulator